MQIQKQEGAKIGEGCGEIETEGFSDSTIAFSPLSLVDFQGPPLFVELLHLLQKKSKCPHCWFLIVPFVLSILFILT